MLIKDLAYSKALTDSKDDKVSAVILDSISFHLKKNIPQNPQDPSLFYFFLFPLSFLSLCQPLFFSLIHTHTHTHININ